MPVPDNYKVAKAAKGEYTVLEPDVYTVQITDIDLEKDVENKFNGKVQDQLIFHLRVLDEHVRAAYLRNYVSSKWFDGGKTGNKSKYYMIVSAVFGYYFKDTDIKTQDEAVMLSGTTVNSLIGKQLRMTVEVIQKQDGSQSNKITGYMAVKKELPPFKEGEEYKSKDVKNAEEVFGK